MFRLFFASLIVTFFDAINLSVSTVKKEANPNGLLYSIWAISSLSGGFWWIEKILLENGYNFLDSDKAAEKASFFESIHHHHHLESQSRNGVLCWSNTGQIRHRRHSLRPCSDICTLCRPVGGERKEQIGLSSEQRQQPFQLLEYQWGEGRFDTLG